MRATLPPLVLALALALAPGAVAAQAQPDLPRQAGEAERARPFVTADEIDLTRLLSPPPEPDSRETKADLARVLTVQVTRTPDMEAQAIADGLQDVSRFADVVGPALVTASLPKLKALFARLDATEEAVTDPAKATWRRPRPVQTSDLVRPVGRISQSGSYPSGHAAFGALTAIVLSDMLPEERAAIMRRGRQYGMNRLVTGNHFPSDIEAGRMAAVAIAAILAGRADYRQAFADAKAELRGALGVPALP